MTSPPCVRCGTFLVAATDVTYSDEGDPMCVACRERIDLESRERRESRTLISLAASSLGGAIFGLPVSFFFILGGLFFSVPAFGTGMLCLRQLRASSPGVLTALGGRRPIVRAAASVGVGLAGLGVVMLVVQILDVLLRIAR